MNKADQLMTRIDEAKRLNRGISEKFVAELANEIKNLLESSQQALNELNTEHASRIPERGALALSERGVLESNGGDLSLQQQAMDRAIHADDGYVPKSALVNNGIPQDFSHAEPKLLSRDPDSRAFGVSRPFCAVGGCEDYIETIADNERKMFAFAMDGGHARANGKMQSGTINLFTPGELIANENGSLTGGGGGSIYEVPVNLSSSDLDNHAKEIAGKILRDNVVSLSQDLLKRGGKKALGPVGYVMDAYSLKQAYDADGGRMGENFKETAGGAVGGVVGGVAMGAAIGSVFPGVGTVIGGVVGGVIGGMAGEKLGGLL